MALENEPRGPATVPKETPLDKLTLREFLATLTQRLQGLSKDELTALILARAREIPPRERSGFLDGFRPLPPVPPKSVSEDDGRGFLADVEDFAERVRKEAFVEGQGWDDEVRDHRTYGDESWAEELEDLFSNARAHYEAGSYRIAREALKKLLDAYHGGLEEGRLPGREPADMLTMDLEEESLRYLRCVYLTEGTSTRPAALREAIAGLGYARRKLGLRAMLDVDPRPLPEWETFGANWTAHLESAPMDRLVSALLTEATELFRGAEGLEVVARRKGAESPGLYVAWVEALGREGRRQDAGEAAKTALAELPGDLAIRARLADLLAAAGRDLGRPEWVAEGLREALRADVSLARLLDCTEAEPSFGGRLARAGEALARIEELKAARAPRDRGSPGALQPDLAAARVEAGVELRARLLRGEYEEAARRLSEAPAEAWPGPENPSRLLVPFFFVARLPRGKALPPNLEELWHDACGSQVYRFSSDGGTEREPSGARFARALEVTLGERPAGEQALDRCFALALASACGTADQIVSGQQRAAYDRAAQLLAAAAEVYASRGAATKGQELLSTYYSRYTRFAAFRKDLRAAAQRGGFTV